MQKPLCKNITAVLFRKTLRKDTKYSRNETILKIGHLAKVIAFAWAIAFAEMVSLGQKLKMPNTSEKPFYYRTLEKFCAKDLSKKHQIFEK